MLRAVSSGVLTKNKGGRKLILTGKSDIGKVREINEDNYVLGELDGAAYAVVCDGMGGAEGGEIASKIATDIIKKQLENSYSGKMKSSAVKHMLISAVVAANISIYDYASQNNLSGMGTTVVALVLKDNVAHIAFDGDSRAYLINEKITQLTDDHTYLRELYKMDKITKEQMEHDPRKNIITRALGVGEDIEVDYVEADVEGGDEILLCSDGLTNSISDDGILEICKTQPFGETAKILVSKANENGGRDNITAVLVLSEEDK